MDNLTFRHPHMPSALGVHVNPNQIEWNYGLNTANYPTYGGEVVQILSAYIDDMTIQGNVSTYHHMEQIYKWFIQYIQIATAEGEYNVRPVTMTYLARDWNFDIYPTGVPGFRYGRDVVAPEWTLKATVVDPDQNHPLKQEVLSASAIAAARDDQGFPLFGKVTGDIGFEEEDPFSGVVENQKKEEFKEKQILEGTAVHNHLKDLADRYNKLLPAYLEGDFSDLTADYSRPALISKEIAAEERVPKGKGKGKGGKNG